MNSTFSLIFSHVFELTSSYTEIPHRRISCVSLIHMKIPRFKVQYNQINFISSCVYLIESISALLVRRMHSISDQKQNNLLFSKKRSQSPFLIFTNERFLLYFYLLKAVFHLKLLETHYFHSLFKLHSFKAVFCSYFSSAILWPP